MVIITKTMEDYKCVWLLTILCVMVNRTEGGECCRAHHDVMGQVLNERWCDDFCCYHGNQFLCCNNIFLRAPAGYRTSFCVNWFTEHIWVPILIALIVMGLLIGCGVCCCCLCC